MGFLWSAFSPRPLRQQLLRFSSKFCLFLHHSALFYLGKIVGILFLELIFQAFFPVFFSFFAAVFVYCFFFPSPAFLFLCIHVRGNFLFKHFPFSFACVNVLRCVFCVSLSICVLHLMHNLWLHISLFIYLSCML